MIEQQGWQKVALPAYDQPLWRGDGSWFEPPTIRGVASIVFEIVGQASSQTWFSYAGAVGAGFTAGLNEISVGARTEKVLNKDTNKMEKVTKYTRAEG